MAEPFRARAILRVLVEHAVDFVVVGGIAGRDKLVASELRTLADEIRARER